MTTEQWTGKFVKGQLILKGLFGVFNSPKKRTKDVFEFSSSLFGRTEDTKKAVRN